jgi:hypothetical protein
MSRMAHPSGTVHLCHHPNIPARPQPAIRPCMPAPPRRIAVDAAGQTVDYGCGWKVDSIRSKVCRPAWNLAAGTDRVIS